MTLTVAILAGGLATRMHPITDKIPKSLIKIDNDYFINHQLHYLSQQGIKKVVLCVGHLGEQIEAVVGPGKTYGMGIQYSWDGLHQLGTGGALKAALPLLGNAFFILYGDSYLPINYAAVEKNFYDYPQLALMTVFRNNNLWQKSNVVVDQNRISEYNKQQPSTAMEYIDYGLSILSASAFQKYPSPRAFDLATLFQELAMQGELRAYEVFERFYEIGSKEGLKELTDRFKE